MTVGRTEYITGASITKRRPGTLAGKRTAKIFLPGSWKSGDEPPPPRRRKYPKGPTTVNGKGCDSVCVCVCVMWVGCGACYKPYKCKSDSYNPAAICPYTRIHTHHQHRRYSTVSFSLCRRRRRRRRFANRRLVSCRCRRCHRDRNARSICTTRGQSNFSWFTLHRGTVVTALPALIVQHWFLAFAVLVIRRHLRIVSKLFFAQANNEKFP